MPDLTDPALRGSSGSSMLERGADGALTIHPDIKRLPKQGSLAALPFALIGAIRLLLLGWVGVAILASVIGVAAGLAFLIRRHRAFHSYARLTPSTLTVKPWYRHPRSVPREAVSKVVLATADLVSSEPSTPLMLFLDGRGRCLLSLNCLGIPPPDASAFAQAVGAPVSSRPESMSPKQLRKEYPGSVSAYYAHQLAWGMGMGIAISALVIVGVVGWAAVTGQLGLTGPSTPPRPAALGVIRSEYAQGTRGIQRVDDVTVTRVDNPAPASTPAPAAEPGTHFVGVALRVKSAGQYISAPSADITLRDAKGERYSVHGADDPAGAKLNTDTGIDSGATETAYVLIRVPDARVISRVEFNSTGDRNDTLTWIVPSQPPPPTPAPARLGQSLSLRDQQVTMLAVDDPAQGRPSTASLPPGDHLVGVEVRIANTGTEDGDPPYQPLSVIDSNGGRSDGADVSANAGVAQKPVKAGQTITATVYFDVPQGARVAEVDYGYYPAGLVGSRATVAWAVPSR